MYEKLLRLVKRPELWQRSAEPFWDDEYISKQMLKAHLDPELEAASRKHAFIDRSAYWLCGVIPPKSRVLDLGNR